MEQFSHEKECNRSGSMGVKLPSDLFKGAEAGDQSGLTLSKLPCLFLDKVSIENVEQRRYVTSSSYYGSV